MNSKKQIIQPFSRKVPVLYGMIFFIPIAICWIWCVCLKLFSFADATSAGIEGANGNKMK